MQWPAGAGAKGNDGVAGTVKNTKGAIGYVEYVYAAKNNLPTVQLKNKSGKFVDPSVEAFKAAAEKADWAGAQDFAASMIDLERRRRLADRLRHLHPPAQGPEGPGQVRRGDEVLRLGLQGRRRRPPRSFTTSRFPTP